MEIGRNGWEKNGPPILNEARRSPLRGWVWIPRAGKSERAYSEFSSGSFSVPGTEGHPGVRCDEGQWDGEWKQQEYRT